MSSSTRQTYKTIFTSYWLKISVVGLLCIFAAAIGAKLQAWHIQKTQKPAVTVIDSSAQDLSPLYKELGALQGKLLALEAQQKSLVEKTGIADELAELQTETKNSDIPDLVSEDFSAISDDLAKLHNKLSFIEDKSNLVAYSISQQTGFHQSLPTFAPVAYPALSSSFGWRKNPVSGRDTMHEGLDFAAPYGAPIFAASGGLVVFAGRLGSYGNLVELDHGNGILTRYAHASKILVKNGDIVLKGQPIAKVGSSGRSTGSHLHFEVRFADYPLDPNLFVSKSLENNQVLAIIDEYFSANNS